MSEGTIECLKKCFANFGIPDTVVSDNASCFMSRETQNFLRNIILNIVQELLIILAQMVWLREQ